MIPAVSVTMCARDQDLYTCVDLNIFFRELLAEGTLGNQDRRWLQYELTAPSLGKSCPEQCLQIFGERT